MALRGVAVLLSRRALLSRGTSTVPVCFLQTRLTRVEAVDPRSFGRRWLSMSSTAHVSNNASFPDYGPQDATNQVFETSSQGRWANDAASLPDVAANLTDLAPQGDLASLELGGYTPIGLLQTTLDFVHQCGVPWWAAIAGLTVLLRLTMFPLVVKLQANAVRMNNIRPQLDKLTARMKQHKQAGNDLLAAQVLAEMQQLYIKNKCHPIKMMGMPLLQVPVFISFFLALRRMAAVPLESMKEGGMLWFQDLTVPDPFYILPLLGCASFMIIMELGGETGVSNPQTRKLKVVFRYLSVIMLIVTVNFPSCLFMYWITSSMFSTVQILLLKIQSFRRALGIPQSIVHPTDKSTTTSGLAASFKESYQSAKLIDAARKKQLSAKKAYDEQLKDKSPKLFDEPPHKRQS